MSEQPKEPSLILSLLPIVVLIGLLTLNVFLFGDDATSGSNQMALLFSAAFGGLIAVQLGFQWKVILDGIVRSISSAMSAILILLLIGLKVVIVKK